MKRLADIEARRYSQNGEDGIIAYLCAGLTDCQRTFVEIGCATGAKCNSAALAHDGWTGVAVDVSAERVRRYGARFPDVRAVCQLVTPFNVMELDLPKRPDVFSLDIDGPDFHVAAALLRCGFAPAVAVVEYNAAFEDRRLTVPYPMPAVDRDFSKYLYFGCGLQAWIGLWGRYGYRFVTVNSAGVNAFFVSERVPYPAGVDWLAWADCAGLATRFGPAPARWAQIAHMEFGTVR